MGDFARQVKETLLLRLTHLNNQKGMNNGYPCGLIKCEGYRPRQPGMEAVDNSVDANLPFRHSLSENQEDDTLFWKITSTIPNLCTFLTARHVFCYTFC
jgi:hypothetical protein